MKVFGLSTISGCSGSALRLPLSTFGVVGVVGVVESMSVSVLLHSEDDSRDASVSIKAAVEMRITVKLAIRFDCCV
jgi:hypothetical protein